MKDTIIAQAIMDELHRQRESIELIASENFVSLDVMQAQGSVLTNKYAEGYPHRRYYGGCEYVDVVEDLARDRLKELFGADHANVQPHSGSQANMAVYMTVLEHGDTVLGMDLAHGGHLTHGHPLNFSGMSYNFVSYGVDEQEEQIDYEAVRSQALLHMPKLIVAGASAYSRTIDFAKFREIADEIGAYLLVDMAHIAGLVAAGVHPSPVPHADFVTSTTHKTMRGPRGGIILCKEQFAKDLDRVVFPGMQGGPLMHVIAAKAVSFGEALQPEFKVYQEQVVKNAQALANKLMELDVRVISKGTDNHLLMFDVKQKYGLSGKDAEARLDQVGITTNKNSIPFDQEKPFITSGIRVGTPAMTTRGFKELEFETVAELIHTTLSMEVTDENIEAVRADVQALLQEFPLYQ